MKKSIIFKPFQTYQSYYVYDRQSNAVICVSKEEYEELKRVEKEELLPKESTVINRYQKQGLFMPGTVKDINHPDTEILEHNAQKRVKQLILQVTQQCNLRCAYCAYSGIYDRNRTHSNERMTFDTAKKAIDFFFEHSTENADVSIGFYGGEPLLEFELIKKCVDYISHTSNGKKISLTMTTNGTLLKGEIADFIVKHEFNIGISLDGSKEEHDVNRKFINGEGSFDIIMNHIKRLSAEHPQYVKQHVKFFTTVNPYMDLGCVLDYFSSSDIIDDNSIMFNTMVPTNIKDDVNVDYKESYFQVRNFEYIKTLFMMIGKLEKEHVSRLTSQSVDNAMKLKKALYFRSPLGTVIHHGGPCQPGILRLFVRVDGTLFPCERVNETLDYYRIGSVNEGYDLNKMQNLLNIGKITENECKEYWNIRHCLMCSNEIEFETRDKPCRENKLEGCKQQKVNAMFVLYQLCVLSEFGYKLSTEVM